MSKSYDLYPIKTIEEHFDATKIDFVASNLLYFLAQKDQSGNRLRVVHFMDMLNKNTDLAYREPYFMIADISDHTAGYTLTTPGGVKTLTAQSYSSMKIGRGTISIDLENEGAGEIFYKLRITTLPYYSKWAFDLCWILINQGVL